MELPEYRVIKTGSEESFIDEINIATAEGFVVQSSNSYTILYDRFTHDYETVFYCLMVKNPSMNDFQFKIMDELNAIKFELKDIVSNLKYLGE